MDRNVPEAIILAGGMGTRLQGVVAGMPKVLAPVDGRPFVSYVLDLLAAAGIRRTVLATGYLAGQVETALGGDWRGMQLAYSVEERPLGTGGAVRKAAAALAGAPILVLNGDTYLEFDPGGFAAAMADAGAEIGVALADVPDVSRYGGVGLEGTRVVAFGEKASHGPGCINAGAYYLSPQAIRDLPDREAFSLEREVLEPAAMQGRLHGYRHTAGFIDIGVPEDYARVQVLARRWQAGER